MRNKWGLGWTGLLVVILALVPSRGQTQDALGYALPDTLLPTPLGGPRPEEGFFGGGDFLLYRQTIPLGHQTVASRGFKDIEGISGNSAFVGSMKEALNTHQVTGPPSYQPGFKIFGGYRFFDGSAVELSWWHLSTVRYSAVATPIPPDLNVGASFQESFLFSPVNNFPLDFSGPGNDVVGASAFGVWNAADLMTISYTQRNEMYELIYRLPAFYESETHRSAAFIGPRMVWFWENFNWKTFDFDLDGQSADVWNAFYSNVISNRMYGIKIGCSNDWYCGNGLSVSFEPFVTPMINFVKEIAKYERGDRHMGPERKRSRTDYTLVPELGASLNLNWYPYEGVQVRAGYNINTYFNTKTSLHPIDFDYSAVAPEYDRAFRLLHGLELGVAFKF